MKKSRLIVTLLHLHFGPNLILLPKSLGAFLDSNYTIIITIMIFLNACDGNNTSILTCDGPNCGCLTDNDCVVTICGPTLLSSAQDCFPDCNCVNGWPMNKNRASEIEQSYIDLCPVDVCRMNCESTSCESHTTTAECHWGHCVAVLVSTEPDSDL